MKRLVSGLLWALVVMWAGAYVTLFLGLPSAMTIPFAVAIGAFVGMDPMNRIWPQAVERTGVTTEMHRTTAELVHTV